jgi:hypothetical protein
MGLELPEASPEHIVAAVDYAVIKGKLDAATCALLVDISPEHADRALRASALLGLLASDGTEYEPSGFASRLIASGSRDQQRQIFRAHLELFAPFAYVRTRLLQGFELHDACRSARALFDLDARPALVRDLLARWGLYSGSLVGDPPVVDTSQGIDSPLARVIDRISDDRVVAAELLGDELGPATYVALAENIRENLLLGVLRLARNDEPRTIVQPLGIALEDYLRLLGGENGVGLDGCNGMTQVAEALVSAGTIASKHLGFVHLVAAIRNASEHGIDQREAEDWQLTAKAAGLVLSAVMSAVRSMQVYVQDARLEL